MAIIWNTFVGCENLVPNVKKQLLIIVANNYRTPEVELSTLKNGNLSFCSPRFLCRLTAFMDLLQPWDVRALYIRKPRICLSSSWSAHFHVSWLSDFIFYQKPLYKSLHQSLFYSFITILPSESSVTLHYNTILPQILLFRHLTSIFESTNVILTE